MNNKTEKFVALVALYIEMGPWALSFFALVCTFSCSKQANIGDLAIYPNSNVF